MTVGGLVLFGIWFGLIYICVNPEAGVRLGQWLQKWDK